MNNRRNFLRNSILAGLASVTGIGLKASPVSYPLPGIPLYGPDSRLNLLAFGLTPNTLSESILRAKKYLKDSGVKTHTIINIPYDEYKVTETIHHYYEDNVTCHFNWGKISSHPNLGDDPMWISHAKKDYTPPVFGILS